MLSDTIVASGWGAEAFRTIIFPPLFLATFPFSPPIAAIARARNEAAHSDNGQTKGMTTWR